MPIMILLIVQKKSIMESCKTMVKEFKGWEIFFIYYRFFLMFVACLVGFSFLFQEIFT